MSNNLDFRYERKFLVKSVSYHWITHFIKMNSAMFQPAYAPRQINNIYFDV